MKDDKTKQDGRDDSKVDANDASEVAYAAKQNGVSATKIKEAIEAVGSSREKIEQYLKGK